MGAWRVTADLLANSRFVVSPLAETVAAMTVLDAPSGPSQAAFRGANRAAYDEMLAAHPDAGPWSPGAAGDRGGGVGRGGWPTC